MLFLYSTDACKPAKPQREWTPFASFIFLQIQSDSTTVSNDTAHRVYIMLAALWKAFVWRVLE